MPRLKRNKSIDDASGGSLSIGCILLLDCLSPRGIHVDASYKILRTNDDSNVSDNGGKFLLQSFMCLTDILVIFFKLNFIAYFEHDVIIYML